MGVYVNALDAVNDAIVNKTSAGESLESIKNVFIMPFVETVSPSDYPYISIKFNRVDEQENFSVGNNSVVGSEGSLTINLYHELKSVTDLYNTATETGLLYLVEKLMDVLGADHTFSGAFEDTDIVMDDIGYDGTSFEYAVAPITLTFKLKPYAFNGRSV